MARTQTARRRRTSAELEEQILDATWAELVDHGWSGLRMEAVATRARVSKASLYERWPNRAALLRAALQHWGRLGDAQVIRDAGDLHSHLLTVLEATAAYLSGPGGEAMRGVASDASLGQRPLPETPLQLVDQVLEQARNDGEVGELPIPLVIRNAGIAIVIEHFLFLGSPPPSEQLDTIVDDLWAPALKISSGLASPATRKQG